MSNFIENIKKATLKDITFTDYLKSLPITIILGCLTALWQGYFAFLILKIGTEIYNWRSFSIIEIIIASAAFEILNNKMYNPDPKHPFRDMAIGFFNPILVYLIVNIIVWFN
jgi:hypothetical protein